MKPKQIFQKYKGLIPVLVLTGICVDTIASFIIRMVEKNGGQFVLTNKHYSAFVAVLITLITFFYFRRHFKYVFLATLLLGLIGILNFTIAETFAYIKIGSIKVGFQATSFKVALLTLILNFKTLFAIIFSDNGKTTEQTLRDNQNFFSEETEKFKRKYINYSTDDLIKIVSEKKHTVSAIEAARQILRDRQVETL